MGLSGPGNCGAAGRCVLSEVNMRASGRRDFERASWGRTLWRFVTRTACGAIRVSREHSLSPPVLPAVMSAAPFVWRADGRPDWAAMWSSFCELALYGGPPHRGDDRPLRAPAVSGPAAASAADMIAEMRRGIQETTGLRAEPYEPGWLAITCDSPKMAAWLCAAIVLENVEANFAQDRLLL